MAEWKKVIISGTNVTLGEVTASGGFSGDGSGLTGVQASGLDIEGFVNGTAITVAATDKLLLSDAGTEKYINVSQLFDTSDFDSEVASNSAVAANTAKVSADGSVTDHSDVTDAGSGAIIADAERDKLANIEAGAEVNVDTNITVAEGANTVEIRSSTGTNDSIAAATTSAAGVMTATDKTKLDGIEANADVTDVTNVTAAGALMDSEVTNLAQVKAFNSADYATAAQGTTADSALQDITGESVTDLTDVTSAGSGAIITSTERTKLNGIEASADVTDTANVTAAGALMDSEVTNLNDVKSFDPADYATAAQGATADNALPASDVSTFGATLIDDASASAARTTLGLGSIATLSSIDISSNTNLAAGTGVTLTGDTLSIGQSVGTSDSVTFNNIVTTGNLTVQGDLTSVNTTNLNVEDKMILLGSGSVTPTDTGIIFGGTNAVANEGDAFFFDAATERPAWSEQVRWNATAVVPTAYIPRVFDIDAGHAEIAERGSIKVQGEEVFIYA